MVCQEDSHKSITTTAAGAADTLMIHQSLDGETYKLRATIPTSLGKKITKVSVGIVALPILLPLGIVYGLVMATPLYKTIMGLFLPFGMQALDQQFRPERKELLKHVSGRVLDVGSGGGAYLQYCSKMANTVVAVEPIEQLHAQIQKAAAQAKLSADKLTIVKDLSELDPAEYQFDWIILGNVLCEVGSVQETLLQLDRLLTPGGKVYFSEHIAHPGGTVRRYLQDWANPLWKIYFGGCNCNRDSIEWMRQTTSWKMIEWVYPQFAFNLGPFVLGLATKPLDGNKKSQ